MRENKTRKVIAICGSWGDEQNLDLFMDELQKKNIKENYLLATFIFGIPSMSGMEGQHREAELVRLCEETNPSAMILFAEMIRDPKLLASLVAYGKERKIPVFMLERSVPGCINVELEYVPAFEQMVRHVVEEHGCLDAEMFAGPRDNEFSDERIAVYRKVLKEHGIEVGYERIHYGDFWDVPAKREMRAILESGRKLPSAYICANDIMAAAVCDVLSEEGIRVPEDVIVTGFDGVWRGTSHDPVISTCKPDLSHVIQQIVEEIETGKMLNGPEEEMVIHTQYYPKYLQSCGCTQRSQSDWEKTIGKLAYDHEDSIRHIRQMSKLVTSSLKMNNFQEAATLVPGALSLWKRYYYIGVFEDGGTRDFVHGDNGVFDCSASIRNENVLLPDLHMLQQKDSGTNVLLVRLLRSDVEIYGYGVVGYWEENLHVQQQFEELSMFFTTIVAAVINNQNLVKANKEIEKLSERDYLTGMYNRRGFLKRMDAMLREPERQEHTLTLAFLDVDELKKTNDNYGHNSGDELIKTMAEAARQLPAYLGLEDCIGARLGGDEFAIALFDEFGVEHDVERIREILEDYAGQMLRLKNRPYTLHVSIGVKVSPVSKCDLREMLEDADEHMYYDKQLRKSKKVVDRV